MCVDLSGGDARVPEHLFYAHDFGAVLEQVRGEAVAQYVRARFSLPADVAQQVVDVVSERAQSERFAVFAQKDVASCGGQVACLYLSLFVILDTVDKAFGQGYNALLVALAEHAHEFRACVDAVPREHLAFRYAQSRTVHEF